MGVGAGVGCRGHGWGARREGSVTSGGRWGGGGRGGEGLESVAGGFGFAGARPALDEVLEGEATECAFGAGGFGEVEAEVKPVSRLEGAFFGECAEELAGVLGGEGLEAAKGVVVGAEVWGEVFGGLFEVADGELDAELVVEDFGALEVFEEVDGSGEVAGFFEAEAEVT